MIEQLNPTGTPLEILIVEDSPVEAEMLRRILVRSGYRVMLAKNGAEGLQALREHPCTLVMSDINMPLMDGYELCHAIKFDEKLWGTPVILVTALSEPKDIIKALDVGADGYITKPYVEDILLGRIRSLLVNPATRKLADERRRIQLEYGGEKHSVAVGSPQMANLMLSVYENSLVLNQELMHIQNQLNLINEGLEERVRERTAALAENEEKFRTAIDVVLDAYIIIEGEHGTITWWNSAAEAMFGYSKQEMTGQTLHDIIVPPRFRDAAQHGLAHFATTGEGAAINKTLELVSLRKNGAEFPIELSLSAMQLNGKWHAIGIVRDITERKRIENALKESEKEYRALADNALLGVYKSNLKGEILYVNDAALRIYGYESREEFISDGALKRYKNLQDRKVFIETLEKEGRLENYELEVLTKSGATKNILVSARLDGDELSGMIMDITERKQAEAQLAEQFEELRRWHEITLGREMRAIELKHEVNELLAQVGQPPRYLSAEASTE